MKSYVYISRRTNSNGIILRLVLFFYDLRREIMTRPMIESIE